MIIFYLKDAKFPCGLKYKNNLPREREVSHAERSQDQMSQINSGKTVYVGNTWLKRYVLKRFLQDKYLDAE